VATLLGSSLSGSTIERRKASRFWWHVHHWAGLKLSLFLSFIFLTGTLATLSHELDWLLQPSLRVAAASVKGPIAWDRIAAEASRRPGVKQIISIDRPIASAFAARVMIVRKDGTYGYLHAHPSTGAIQGEGHWVGAARILRNMHRHLNLPTKIGVPIVSALSFLMLVSLGTALIVYKKWWRGFLKPVRFRDARTAWGDVHRLAGLWSLWFAALIALTGVWYFVESIAFPAPSPPRAQVAPIDAPLPEIGKRVAASLSAARIADPELRIEMLIFPTAKVGAFVFQGQRSAILVRPRANTIWTDVRSGEVLLTTDARAMTLHQRIGEAADPLHFGTFGGYWTKLVWFVFGLILTSLSLSGMAIYSLRIAREPGLQTAVTRVWRGMGVWRWLSALLIAASFIMLPALFLLTAE
jgi:uncharacterized iron-regulated membrane protein